MTRVYIYGPAIMPDYWEHSMYLYARALSRLLKNNNINNEIVRNLPEDLNKNDLVFTFQPYYQKHLFNCKIIFINTEAVAVRGNIPDQLEDQNVKLIWDYNYKNINILKSLTSKQIDFVPPLYDSIFEEHFIREDLPKDIDFLFYGVMNERRSKIIDELCSRYVVSIFRSSDYKTLYNLINRSKIVLIINFYSNNFPVDFYRLNFLVCNKIFVINEELQEDEIELRQKIGEKMVFSKYEDYLHTCGKYISLTQEQRNYMVNDTYEWYKKNFNFIDYVPINKVKELM